MAYRRILLPVDGSAMDEQWLPNTIAIAEAFATSVVVLEVVETPFGQLAHLGSRDDTTEETVLQQVADARARAYANVRRVAALLRPNVLLVDELVLDGQPGPAILRAADEESCDLIVMSTNGRGGAVHGTLGTVTDYVVRHATVPVLVNHPIEAEAEAERTLATARDA